ncbi:MAG: hypothetical protein ACE5KF_00920 [Kiloniellaceae bacterium]
MPRVPGVITAKGNDCPVSRGSLVPFMRVANRHGETVLEKSLCTSRGYLAVRQLPPISWILDFYRWRRGGGRTQPKRINPKP